MATKNSLTQDKLVLQYLREHGSITSLEAIQEFGCTRLAARIWQLRHRGHLIHTVNITGKNRFDQTVTFAKYILDEDNDTDQEAC